MSRLPTPGGDDNTWGDILNDFLSVEHNTDGTLKKSFVETTDARLADARLTVKKQGAAIGTRKNLNLIPGSNVTITATDQSASDTVDVTITGSTGSANSAAVFASDYIVGDGVADDHAALQTAINDAISRKVPLLLPGGTIRSSSTLVWNSQDCAIAGIGGKLTIIQFDDNSIPGLAVDPQIKNSGRSDPSGYIRDIQLKGPTVRPTNWSTTGRNAAGLLLDGIRRLEVRNIYLYGWDIGIDMINNCFLTRFHNAFTDTNCNIGIRLRGTPKAGGGYADSGSDIEFYDCGFGANECAIWIDPYGGGYRFYGGQASAVCQSSKFSAWSSDRLGAVCMGGYLEDFGPGSTWDGTSAGRTGLYYGSTSVYFYGTSFEGTLNGWVHRIFEPGTLKIFGANYNADANFQGGGPSYPLAPYGIFKTTINYNDILLFDTCEVKGNWKGGSTSGTLLEGLRTNYSGGGDTPHMREMDTFGNATVNGVSVNFYTTGLFEAAQAAKTVFVHNKRLGLNGVIIERNQTNGQLEVSDDWGVTYRPLGTRKINATKTAAYTATAADDMVLCDPSSASFNVTLPAASSNASAKITVKHVGSANTVGIVSTGGNVEFTSSFTLVNKGDSATFRSNGTDWYVE